MAGMKEFRKMFARTVQYSKLFVLLGEKTAGRSNTTDYTDPYSKHTDSDIDIPVDNHMLLKYKKLLWL